MQLAEAVCRRRRSYLVDVRPRRRQILQRVALEALAFVKPPRPRRADLQVPQVPCPGGSSVVGVDELAARISSTWARIGLGWTKKRDQVFTRYVSIARPSSARTPGRSLDSCACSALPGRSRCPRQVTPSAAGRLEAVGGVVGEGLSRPAPRARASVAVEKATGRGFTSRRPLREPRRGVAAPSGCRVGRRRGCRVGAGGLVRRGGRADQGQDGGTSGCWFTADLLPSGPTRNCPTGAGRRRGSTRTRAQGLHQPGVRRLVPDPRSGIRIALDGAGLIRASVTRANPSFLRERRRVSPEPTRSLHHLGAAGSVL